MRPMLVAVLACVGAAGAGLGVVVPPGRFDRRGPEAWAYDGCVPSPDGRFVALQVVLAETGMAARWACRVWVIPTEGGPRVEVAGRGLRIGPAPWRDDGRLEVSAPDGGRAWRLRRVDPRTGRAIGDGTSTPSPTVSDPRAWCEVAPAPEIGGYEARWRDRGIVRPVPDTLRPPVPSPLAGTVFRLAEMRDLVRLDLESGAETTIARDLSPADFQVSRTGRFVEIRREEGVTLLDVADGRVVAGPWRDAYPSFGDPLDRVALVHAPNDDREAVVDLANGRRIALEGTGRLVDARLLDDGRILGVRLDGESFVLDLHEADGRLARRLFPASDGERR